MRRLKTIFHRRSGERESFPEMNLVWTIIISEHWRFFSLRDIQHVSGICSHFRSIAIPVIEKHFVFRGGDLLPDALKRKIADWLPHKKFTLLYKATTDGFLATSFHKKCDDQGHTLTIIQTKDGYLFGGYTSQSWSSANNKWGIWKPDPTAFLFTLTNPHDHPPTTCPLQPGHAKHAILCYPTCCAIFGAGHDLMLESRSNEHNHSMTVFSSFVDVVGKGSESFTGSAHFTTSDIEVFAVTY